MEARHTGTDVRGKEFELLTTTDEVSVDGFSCRCVLPLEEVALIEVFQLGCSEQRHVGVARLMRTQWCDLPWRPCGFQFVEKTGDWILNEEKTGARII